MTQKEHNKKLLFKATTYDVLGKLTFQRNNKTSLFDADINKDTGFAVAF